MVDRRKINMVDGEEEISDQVMLSNTLDASSEFQDSTSIDEFLDGFLKNTQTCTHTHTCNPPGPDAVHTHTCYHTHTQVFTSEEDDGPNDKQQSSLKSRRPAGNREAVRKYREKKKAHTAYLEEEVKKLRLLNQQLIRKLQGQAMLEAEVLRLRSILLDLRGKIDIELGVFPSEKRRSSSGFKEGDCRVQSNGAGIGLHCETNVPCLHPHIGLSLPAGVGDSTKMTVTWGGSCEPAIMSCEATPNGVVGHDLNSRSPNTMDTDRSLVSSMPQTE